jgi:hypothetical protein
VAKLNYLPGGVALATGVGMGVVERLTHSDPGTLRLGEVLYLGAAFGGGALGERKGVDPNIDYALMTAAVALLAEKIPGAVWPQGSRHT